MELLVNAKDFSWYKARLDVERKYKHGHEGEPDHYPCKVESEYWDDPNGPYMYTHTFIYQTESVGGECGHKQLVWPKEYE